MKTDRLVDPVLLTGVLVVAFTTYWALPVEVAEPRTGVTLAGLDLLSVGPGETHTDDFVVGADYTSIGLSYNITTAYWIDVALIAPDGTRTAADVEQTTDGPRLDLEVRAPMHGLWVLEVTTRAAAPSADDPDPGIHEGRFRVLGFGGPATPGST